MGYINKLVIVKLNGLGFLLLGLGNSCGLGKVWGLGLCKGLWIGFIRFS